MRSSPSTDVLFLLPDLLEMLEVTLELATNVLTHSDLVPDEIHLKAHHFTVGYAFTASFLNQAWALEDTLRSWQRYLECMEEESLEAEASIPF